MIVDRKLEALITPWSTAEKYPQSAPCPENNSTSSLALFFSMPAFVGCSCGDFMMVIIYYFERSILTDLGLEKAYNRKAGP
jgi:hypothetical protein